MPSKVSFFSPAVYRKNLTRFAPLWLAYLGIWLVIMPLSILSRRGDQYFDVWSIQRMALHVETATLITMVYAIFVAMALHGWYYKTASVNALAVLPVRREAWFCTNLVTALTMGLIPNLIVALLTWAAAASMGLSAGMAVMTWLSIASLLYLFFYALAALCAALVGQILALPVLYVLANFTAVVINYVTVNILATFVYGLDARGYTVLAPLSPTFYLFSRQNVYIEYFGDGLSEGSQIIGISFLHWGYLLALTIAAVVLLAAAFLLFRRRRMEAAGDVIAVRPLRPVFKYCFAAGCALVLGSLAAFLFFEGSGNPSLAVMLLCLLAGGFIGYFTAEILLKKTFRVFGREWVGYGVFALCLTAAVLMMEFDVTGFERRVPQLEDVEQVSIWCSGTNGSTIIVDDPDYIADFIALHQSIIQDKRNQETLSSSDMGRGVDMAHIYLDYYLKNGAIMEREYTVYCTEEQWRSMDSPGRRMNELLSEPDLATLSCLPDFPIQGPQNISAADFYNYAAEPIQAAAESAGKTVTKPASELSLSQEEAYEIFTNCVLPDLREGKIGLPQLYYFFVNENPSYDASIEFRFYAKPDNYSWCALTLTPGSRTAQYFIDRGHVLLTVAEEEALWETIQ